MCTADPTGVKLSCQSTYDPSTFFVSFAATCNGTPTVIEASPCRRTPRPASSLSCPCPQRAAPPLLLDLPTL